MLDLLARWVSRQPGLPMDSFAVALSTLGDRLASLVLVGAIILLDTDPRHRVLFASILSLELGSYWLQMVVAAGRASPPPIRIRGESFVDNGNGDTGIGAGLGWAGDVGEGRNSIGGSSVGGRRGCGGWGGCLLRKSDAVRMDFVGHLMLRQPGLLTLVSFGSEAFLFLSYSFLPAVSALLRYSPACYIGTPATFYDYGAFSSTALGGRGLSGEMEEAVTGAPGVDAMFFSPILTWWLRPAWMALMVCCGVRQLINVVQVCTYMWTSL
ncbi:unnamed protein product [Choristocarpus tenellus]